MATRKKADTGSEQPTQEELQAQFIERLKSAASFDGGLTKVDCDLPGYEGVSVYYNTDNTFEMGVLFALASIGISLEDRGRLWSLFVRRIEWPFKNAQGEPLPAPTPDQPQKYVQLFMQFRPLAQWIQGEGYTKAKDERWGNSLAPSAPTSKSED